MTGLPKPLHSDGSGHTRRSARIIEPINASFDDVSLAVCGPQTVLPRPSIVVPVAVQQVKISCTFNALVSADLLRSSKARGITPEQLAKKIVEIVFRDNLLRAVLDD